MPDLRPTKDSLQESISLEGTRKKLKKQETYSGGLSICLFFQKSSAMFHNVTMV